MAVEVALRNERTGEVKQVKVGWSWVLFFFSGFLGIPLFLRRLYAWGGAMVAFWAVAQIAPALTPDPDERLGMNVVVWLLGLGLAIFFGIKGNELTAKNLLENGWEWAEPDDQMTHYAKGKWALA